MSQQHPSRARCVTMRYHTSLSRVVRVFTDGERRYTRVIITYRAKHGFLHVLWCICVLFVAPYFFCRIRPFRFTTEIVASSRVTRYSGLHLNLFVRGGIFFRCFSSSTAFVLVLNSTLVFFFFQ